MKRLILAILFFILHNGVSGYETDGVKSLSVMEGDSLPLYTCLNDIQKYETILWMFESGNALIAEFANKKVTFPDGNKRFIDRLKMDSKTGSLTIRNIRSNHSGVYSVEMISKSEPQYLRRFNVTVVDVFDPHADKIIQKSAKEGESVTLRTEIKVQKDVLILWKFAGTKHSIYSKDVATIGKIDGEAPGELLDYGENEEFKKRLKIESLTGSLTITNIRLEHAGFYTMQIHNNTVTRFRSFNITVRADSHSCLEEIWKPLAIAFIVIAIMLGVMLSFFLPVVIRKCKVFCSKKALSDSDSEKHTHDSEKQKDRDDATLLPSEGKPSSREVLSRSQSNNDLELTTRSV